MRTMLVSGMLVLAAAGLTACEPTKVGPGADRDVQRQEDDRRVALPKVELPPSIRASKSYRCADNSLLMAEWYSDDLSASVRTKADSPSVRVKAPAVGQPMVADGGWSLKGGYKDAKVTFASPDHPKPMTCHV
jgi:predicted small secreted protein